MWDLWHFSAHNRLWAILWLAIWLKKILNFIIFPYSILPNNKRLIKCTTKKVLPPGCSLKQVPCLSCSCLSIHLSVCHSFLPEASFGHWVLSLPASVCVCPCVCQSVCQSLACPHDNSGPVQARITKFGPKMQKTLVKVPIVLGGNWPWPSRSNLT